MKRNHKRGQVWTADFITGFLLFVLAVVMCIAIMMGMTDKNDYEKTYREAIYLSDTLLSAGYPSGWNDTNVIVPGIAKNNRINTSKLESYMLIGYPRTKTLLHITGDYIFFFENSTGIINLTLSNESRCIYGYPINASQGCNPDMDSIVHEDLVRMERIVIINSTLVKMNVYLWDY